MNVLFLGSSRLRLEKLFLPLAVKTVFFVVLLAEAAVAMAATAGGEAIDEDPAGDGVVGGASPPPTALVVVSADCGMAMRSPALASAADGTGCCGCGRSAFRFRAEEEDVAGT